jgi:hypothetical protein
MKKLIICFILTVLLVGCGSSSSSSSNGFTVTEMTPSTESSIAIDQSFLATFSNELSPDAVNGVVMLDKDNKEIAVTCELANNTSMLCQPKQDLNFSQPYQLVFTDKITNVAQNPLNQTKFDYTTSDNTFAVEQVSPLSGAEISINQSFLATFNNDLSATSVDGVYIEDHNGVNIPVMCELASKNSLLCQPKQELEYNGTYKLIFTNQITNTSQHPLNETLYIYKTYTSPAVSSVSPQSGAIHPNNTTFTIMFAESMNEATLDSITTPGNVTLQDTTTGQSVSISCIADNSNTMVCNAAVSQLSINNSYILTLTTLIHELINNTPIIEQHINYSVTNYTTPTILTAFPSDGSNVTLLTLNYNYIFSEPMNINSFEGNVSFINTTANVSYSVNCSSSDNESITCTPVGISQLASFESYQMVFSNKVLSSQNIAFAGATFNYYAGNFVTPQVQSLTPSNGSTIPLTPNTFKITFNTNMNQATLNNTTTPGIVQLTNEVGEKTPLSCTAASSTQMDCVVSVVLAPNGNYHLTLNSNILSDQNVSLQSVTYNYSTSVNYTWTLLMSNTCDCSYRVYKDFYGNMYSTMIDTTNQIYQSYNITNQQISSLSSYAPILHQIGSPTLYNNNQILNYYSSNNINTPASGIQYFNGAWQNITGAYSFVYFTGVAPMNISTDFQASFIVMQGNNWETAFQLLNITNGVITPLVIPEETVAVSHSQSSIYILATSGNIYSYDNNSTWRLITQNKNVYPSKYSIFSVSNNGNILLADSHSSNIWLFKDGGWKNIGIASITEGVVSNDSVYTVKYSTVMHYNIANETWEFISPPGSPAYSFDSIAVDNNNVVYLGDTMIDSNYLPAVWAGKAQ